MLRRLFAVVSVALLATVGFAPAANAAVSEPAFSAIGVSSLWDRGFKGEGYSIAFIDQGVNLNHEYFQGEVIDGYCLYAAQTSNLCPNGTKNQTGVAAASQRIVNNFPVLQENHGNMVAGIAAGKPNSVAPGGVAPDSKIVMANIDLTLAGITAAAQYILDRADENKTAALSLSFGGLFQQLPRTWLKCDDNPELAGLATVFRKLRDKGIITFASAGNTPTLDIATSVFPSCLREVVAVGSVDQQNQVSWYVTMSQKIELLAPDYAVSANTIGYLTSSGTSAAAPMAAASFTLLRQAFPNASSETILSVMKSSGTKIDDVLRKGIPMVNLASAYAQLASGNTPVEQKVTIGTFNGFIAIYTQGYEGRRLTAKVAGRWLAVNPIVNVPGQNYSLVKRNTGAGFRINVEVFIDGVKVASQQVLTR